MVQRYDPDVNCHIADDGDYVEYEDYEKLVRNLGNIDNCLAIIANTKSEEGVRDLPALLNNLKKYVEQALKEAEKPLKENSNGMSI